MRQWGKRATEEIDFLHARIIREVDNAYGDGGKILDVGDWLLLKRQIVKMMDYGELLVIRRSNFEEKRR